MPSIYAFGVALVVAVVHSALEITSRVTPDGKWAGEKEDALWWSEWAATALAGLVALLVTSSKAHKVLATTQVVLVIASVTFVCLILPHFVKYFCTPRDGKKRGWRHIIAADALGVLPLIAAASAGVKIHG